MMRAYFRVVNSVVAIRSLKIQYQVKDYIMSLKIIC